MKLSSGKVEVLNQNTELYHILHLLAINYFVISSFIFILTFYYIIHTSQQINVLDTLHKQI